MMAARSLQAVIYCGLLAILARQAVAQNSIAFLRGTVSVVEEDVLLDIIVSIVNITDGDPVDNTLTQPIMARVSTADIDAQAPEGDYISLINERVEFTIGSAVNSRQVARVRINEDSRVEGDETFMVFFEMPDGGEGDTTNFVIGNTSTTIVTIIDDDFPIRIGLVPVPPVLEGEIAQVCVRIMEGETSGRVFTINYFTSDNQAQAGSDYTAVLDSFTFSDGVSEQCFDVQTREDRVNEVDECFNVNISPSGNPPDLTLSPSVTPVCIQDDDPTIIGLQPVDDVEEGQDSQVCISIDNSGGSVGTRSFSIDYTTENIGGAIGPGDYTPTSGTFVFSASTPTTQCFDVPTSPDNINEDRECFNVRISTPSTLGLSLNPDTTTACIIEAVIVRPLFPSYSVPEDVDDGRVLVCVEAINLNGDLTIGYTTANIPDRAVAGFDYTTAAGTLSFDTINTLACVPIPITDDRLLEDTECLEFRLTSTAGVMLPQPITSVCILDDERIFGFEPPSYCVDENVSPWVFRVCVVLREGVIRDEESIRIDLTLTQSLEGTAQLDVDFEQVSPNPFPLVFNSDNQNQMLCAGVNIRNDLIYEGNETFYASISDPTNDASFTFDEAIARITIKEDDPPPPTFGPPMVGDDPHFAIFLPSGKLLCYTVQGEHSFAFNLISNEKVQMNALFVPDSRREEVTWIGSLGIVVKNAHFQGSNTTRIRFDARANLIHINDKVTLEAKNIETITFHNGKLHISEGPMIESFHYPSVRVSLEDQGMKFTVNFTGEHLDMMWDKLEGNEHSHGLIGQFFRKGVEIDAARKLLLLPNKDPVPVMRKPVWAYMEHNVRSDQLCWVAMNPGYQGHRLIDGHYLDYVVDNVLSTDFKFECKHK